MLFDREFLIDRIEGLEPIIENCFLEQRRWYLLFQMVFEHEGKFYSSIYRTPATEIQENEPYQEHLTEIECPEVFPVQETITVYKTKTEG